MTKLFNTNKKLLLIIILLITPASVYSDEADKQKNNEKEEQGYEKDSHSVIYITIGGGYNYPDGTVAGNGDQKRTKKQAYHLGIDYEYKFHNNWALNLGIEYYSKEFSISKTYNTYELEYKVSGNFLGISPEILFLYKYFYCSTGFFYGYKIGDEKHNVNYDSNFNLNYEYEDYEYGALMSLGTRFYLNEFLATKIGVKINYSNTSIYKNELNDEINNISAGLEFSVGYRF